MSESVVEPQKQRPRILRALGAMNDRRMAAMFLLAFAAGIPYGAVLGALNAWLTKVGVTPSEIGVLSFIILAYSYKFIWSPAFLKPAYPVEQKFGARRAWLLTFQLFIAILIGALALTNPASQITLVAGIALLIALSSATHDIVLDAWRIEVAETDEDLDLMSALYQFGYRLAGLITGALALVLAGRIGWPATYGVLGGLMVLTMLGTLLAPEPKIHQTKSMKDIAEESGVETRSRDISVIFTAIAWVAAIFMIVSFSYSLLSYTPPVEDAAGATLGKPNARLFIREQGPWIIVLTIVLPAIAAAVLLQREKIPGALRKSSDALFASIMVPLMDLVRRLGWAALLVLALVLTYRFADLVWGAFAYPFYLDDRFGALTRTMDEIALASKTFGVIMTIVGSGVGAIALLFLGRMPCLILGALLAAATNLLFADLAAGRFIAETATFIPVGGGENVAAFLSFTGLDNLLNLMPPLFGLENSQGLTNLMGAIAGENLAVGFASVAIVAYLTSIVNPKYAAVQYALLASMTMLIGSLGRAPLGDMIETDGYYAVFLLTFWIGLIPVALSIIEWIRQSRSGNKFGLDT